MKSLVGIAIVFLGVTPSILEAQSHIYGGVTQAAVDKLLDDAQYPVTVVKRDAHPVTSTANLTPDQVNALIDAAGRTHCTKASKDLACGLLTARQKIEKVITRVKALRAKTLKAGHEWKGPDEKGIEAAAFLCFDPSVVISHLQINLLDRPGLTVSGSAIGVSNLHLDTDLTLQVWSSVPEWVCDAHCFGICCWGHFHCSDRPVQIGEVTIRDFKTSTSGSVALSASGPLVKGTPSLTQFLVTFQILGIDITLDITGLLNLFIRPEPRTIYDASVLVASVPVLNTSYAVDAITLSGATELRVDVTLKKAPAVIRKAKKLTSASAKGKV